MTHEHNEREPLLNDDTSREQREYDAINEERSKKTSLPKLQLAIVILIQLCEPITATVIFPFINQLIRDLGVTGGDETKVGYYAGVVESIFYVTEGLTAFAWGRLSDRIGRRPVLLSGLVILTLASGSFGLTHQYWSLMISRGLQGACNGNIGVTKSVMAEIIDPSNVARVYGAMPAIWSTGVTVGPIIGGMLSEPAKRWPEVFRNLALFRSYPYFLPCAVAALFVLIVWVLAFLGLKETLPSIKQKKSSTHEGDDQCTEGDVQRPPVLPIKSLLTRRALLVLVNYALLCFVEQSSNVLLPLFWATSIEAGGLGFSPFRIGSILGTFGAINGVFQILTFGPLTDRFGARNLYIAGTAALMFNMLSYIAATFFVQRAGYADGWVWACIVTQLMSIMVCYMSYGSIFVFTIDVAPPGGLASMNGLAQSAATIMRACAPSVASSLFSITLQHRLLGGTLVYVVLLFAAMIATFVSFYLPMIQKGH